MHPAPHDNSVQTRRCMSGGASECDIHFTLACMTGSLATRIPPAGQILCLGSAWAVGPFGLCYATLGCTVHMEIVVTTPLGSGSLAMTTLVCAPCACCVAHLRLSRTHQSWALGQGLVPKFGRSVSNLTKSQTN